jgi:hypothetical protein
VPYVLAYWAHKQKERITNGINADLVITVVKTSRDPGDRYSGTSLLVLERGKPDSNAAVTSTSTACIRRAPPSLVHRLVILTVERFVTEVCARRRTFSQRN